MNFRTESLDLPQNEHRRCLSFDMGVSSRAVAQKETRESWTPCRMGSSGGQNGGAAGRRRVGCKNRIDDAVRLGFFGAHVAVPVHVFLDLLDGLAGVLRVELVHLGAQIENLARLDLDVR